MDLSAYNALDIKPKTPTSPKLICFNKLVSDQSVILQSTEHILKWNRDQHPTNCPDVRVVETIQLVQWNSRKLASDASSLNNPLLFKSRRTIGHGVPIECEAIWQSINQSINWCWLCQQIRYPLSMIQLTSIKVNWVQINGLGVLTPIGPEEPLIALSPTTSMDQWINWTQLNSIEPNSTRFNSTKPDWTQLSVIPPISIAWPMVLSRGCHPSPTSTQFLDLLYNYGRNAVSYTSKSPVDALIQLMSSRHPTSWIPSNNLMFHDVPSCFAAAHHIIPPLTYDEIPARDTVTIAYILVHSHIHWPVYL